MKYGVNYRLGGSQGRLPMTNWTGLYVGIVGGTAVSEVRATDVGNIGAFPGGEIGENETGLTVGGQLGYNWQFAPAWVVGVEGDCSWLGVDQSRLNFNDPTPAAIFGVKTKSVA